MISATHRVTTDCPVCGYKKALSITEMQGKKLYYCHAGCSQDSLWRVIKGDVPPTHQPRLKTHQRVSNESQAIVHELWSKSLPAKDTPVESYLKGRSLGGLIPSDIRYIPDLLHKPTGTRWPVMLAAVTDSKNKIQALHRTYLAIDGVGKAPVEPVKMTLGPVGGFAVHLAPASRTLAISEGIETALSVMQSTGIPSWSAISAGGMRQLVLPPLPLASEILIAADADAVGLKSANDTAMKLSLEGRSVRICTPPQGKDFNDVIRALTGVLESKGIHKSVEM